MVHDQAVPVALIRTVGERPNQLVSIWGDEVRFMPAAKFSSMIEQNPQLNIRLGSIDFVRACRESLL